MPKWGAPIFHYGTIAAIAGHVLGILIPEAPRSWSSAGLSYWPRAAFSYRRVRATTSGVDYLALVLLLISILTGIAPTISVQLAGHGYDYRNTVGV